MITTPPPLTPTGCSESVGSAIYDGRPRPPTDRTFARSLALSVGVHVMVVVAGVLFQFQALSPPDAPPNPVFEVVVLTERDQILATAPAVAGAHAAHMYTVSRALAPPTPTPRRRIVNHPQPHRPPVPPLTVTAPEALEPPPPDTAFRFDHPKPTVTSTEQPPLPVPTEAVAPTDQVQPDNASDSAAPELTTFDREPDEQPSETTSPISPPVTRVVAKSPVESESAAPKSTRIATASATQPAQSYFNAVRAEILRNLHYPAAARRRGLEGTTVLDLLIADSGTALDANVQNSSGYAVLDRAAIQGAMAGRYPTSPVATADSRIKLSVPITFRLQ